MKRSIILGAAAFLFAIGSAFVSKNTTNRPTTILYKQSASVPSQCVISDCNLTSVKPCLTQSYTTKLDANHCDVPINSFRNN